MFGQYVTPGSKALRTHGLRSLCPKTMFYRAFGLFGFESLTRGPKRTPKGTTAESSGSCIGPDRCFDCRVRGSLVQMQLSKPEGPSTQYFRTGVTKSIEGMVFGTGDLRYWVFGPFGQELGVFLQSCVSVQEEKTGFGSTKMRSECRFFAVGCELPVMRILTLLGDKPPILHQALNIPKQASVLWSTGPQASKGFEQDACTQYYRLHTLYYV